ncbi:MAG: diacylglycerol kinase family lipid kinase [Myxococcales bacterium]|nr:diacylglycerol kinase family lipid kinase [Myxococcales bacterium]
MSTHVIVNPKAGSGRAASRLPEVRRALAGAGVDFEIRETRAPGHATELLNEARQAGIETVAVVGGDGTLNEVSQGYLDTAGAFLPGPRLSLIPAGTGGDFRKTFGFEESIEDAARRLGRGKTRSIDLGVLRCSDGKAEVTRAFLNIMSFGIGGLTDRLVNAGPKWLGGKAAFFLGTFRALLSYRNVPVEVRVDDEPWLIGPILNVAVANGQYFGGGMHIAPEADPGDGWFDIVALGDISAGRSLAMTPRVYKGTHVGQHQVLSCRGKRLEARPLDDVAEVLIDNDGETPGRLPIRAELIPSAIQLVV